MDILRNLLNKDKNEDQSTQSSSPQSGLTGQGSHFGAGEDTTNSSAGHTSDIPQPQIDSARSDDIGTATIGETSTYSSHSLGRGDTLGSVIDPRSKDPTTYKTPEHSYTQPGPTSGMSSASAATGVPSGAAGTAALLAFQSHSDSSTSRIPGAFPGDESSITSSTPAASASRTGLGSARSTDTGAVNISSAAPSSTTAELAGNVPRETTTSGVPGVVQDSITRAHTDPEAAGSSEAVREKSQLEQELLQKVPEAPGMTQAGTVASGVPGVVSDSISRAHTGPEAAASPEAVREKSQVEHELLAKVPEEPSATEAGTVASAVPGVVSDSISRAHTGPEAASSAEAVREKSQVEHELLEKVPEAPGGSGFETTRSELGRDGPHGHSIATSGLAAGAGAGIAAGAGLAGLGTSTATSRSGDTESARQSGTGHGLLYDSVTVPSSSSTPTSYPTDRSSDYSHAETRGTPSTQPTGQSTTRDTTSTESHKSGTVGKLLGAVGIGSSAGGIAASRADDQRGTSERSSEHPVTTTGTDSYSTPSQSGRPSHGRKESIPTTAYPAGPSSPSPINAPVGGTSSSSYPVAAQETSGPGLNAPASSQARALPPSDRSEHESHAGRNAGLAAAGLGGAGAAAYGAHEYGQDRSQNEQYSRETGISGSNTQPMSLPGDSSVSRQATGLDTRGDDHTRTTTTTEPQSESHAGRNAGLGAAGLGAAGTTAYGAHEYDSHKSPAEGYTSQSGMPSDYQRDAPSTTPFTGQTTATSAGAPYEDVRHGHGGQPSTTSTQQPSYHRTQGTAVKDTAQQDDSHDGRDAALAGAGGAGAGLVGYEALSNRSEQPQSTEQFANRSQQATYDPTTQTGTATSQMPIREKAAATVPASEKVTQQDPAQANERSTRHDPARTTEMTARQEPVVGNERSTRQEPATDVKKDDSHTGRDAALAGAAGTGAAAYGAHEYNEHHAEDEAARRQKDIDEQEAARRKQFEKDQKAAEKQAHKEEKQHEKDAKKAEKQPEKELKKEEKEHHKELEKEEKKHEKEIEKEEHNREKVVAAEEAKRHKELEKEEHKRDKVITAEEAKHHQELERQERERHEAEEAERRRYEKETAAAVGTGAAGTAAYTTQGQVRGQHPTVVEDPSGHTKLHKDPPQKKPGFFKRIFKRRQNKDTGVDEEYSTDEEDTTQHGYGTHHGTEAAGVGALGAGTASSTHETSGGHHKPTYEEISGGATKPSYNLFHRDSPDSVAQTTHGTTGTTTDGGAGYDAQHEGVTGTAGTLASSKEAPLGAGSNTTAAGQTIGGGERALGNTSASGAAVGHNTTSMADPAASHQGH